MWQARIGGLRLVGKAQGTFSAAVRALLSPAEKVRWTQDRSCPFGCPQEDSFVHRVLECTESLGHEAKGGYSLEQDRWKQSLGGWEFEREMDSEWVDRPMGVCWFLAKKKGEQARKGANKSRMESLDGGSVRSNESYCQRDLENHTRPWIRGKEVPAKWKVTKDQTQQVSTS